MERNITYMSKGDLSSKEKYSSGMRTLSNYCNDNWLIHPLPQMGVNKFAFTMIMDLFTPSLRKRECKYSIHDKN